MEYLPWEHYPEFWKTESAFLSFIRGGIRRHLWAKNPIKLSLLKDRRIRIINPNVKGRKAHPTVWGFVCEQCQKEVSKVEVDHRTGEYSLRKVSDIQSFVEGIVFVKKEDLAILCKPCHKIKTHSERSGLSLEDAAIDKEAIAICKGSAAEVKAWIVSKGEIPAKTVPERKAQVKRILKEV